MARWARRPRLKVKGEPTCLIPPTERPRSINPSETGYAPVNGLQVLLRLRGGDVNGDFVGVPSSQLAVFPGTTHFFGLARTALVLNVVLTFLEAPLPED